MVVGSLVLLVVGGFFYLVYLIVQDIEQDRKESAKPTFVTLTVSYDSVSCPRTHPLLAVIQNNNPKSLTKTQWQLEAYNPGFSSNVVEGRHFYETDRIVSSSGEYRLCVVLPQLRGALDPSRLNWQVVNGKVSFGQ